MVLAIGVYAARLARSERCDFDWIPRPEKSAKVFDSFVYNGEQDMLLVRFNTLRHLVDHFVVVESRQTHQGHAKELHFEKALPLLGDIPPDQVIHLVLPELSGEGPWERENFQRRVIFQLGLAQPGREAREGDLVILSDLDEIPKPDVISALRGNSGQPRVISLVCPVSYYSFANEGGLWSKLKVVTWEPGLDAQDIRMGDGDCELPSSCWHCSYCFSTIAAMHRKIKASAHTELDTATFTDPARIISYTRLGLDLFDRQDTYAINRAPDAPAYVKASSRLQYMLDRNRTDAGYTDAQHFISVWT